MDGTPVDGSVAGFREAFLHLLREPFDIERLGAMSRRRIEDYSGENMEDRECAMVTELINNADAAQNFS